MQQIAQQTGVSTATVSMALRDVGRMAPETRQRIKLAAAALDYHAHPVISQACSLARRSSLRIYRETLGFMIEYPMEESGYYQRVLYAGAKEQAAKQGYKLETFLVSGKRSDQHRLSRILTARGIRGLIFVQRLESRQPRLSFEWKKFVAVEIQRTIWIPQNLHHIGFVDYHNILEAMHLLKRVGYKRIGMAIEPAQNHHQRGIYNAAYLMLQSKIPVSKRIPPLLSYGPWKEATFQKWMKRYQPDVLYMHHNPQLGPNNTNSGPGTESSDAMMGHGPWLKNMGLRVPEDISLFCENVQRSDYAGLRRDYAGMGRSAVEMVSLLLGNNALGLAGNPRSWDVDELWQPGSTLSRSIAEYISPEGFLVRRFSAAG